MMSNLPKVRLNKAEIGLPEEKLVVVPCRWSHTGWKYVTYEPTEKRFFNHPNRINSFGIMPKKPAPYRPDPYND